MTERDEALERARNEIARRRDPKAFSPESDMGIQLREHRQEVAFHEADWLLPIVKAYGDGVRREALEGALKLVDSKSGYKSYSPDDIESGFEMGWNSACESIADDIRALIDKPGGAA